MILAYFYYIRDKMVIRAVCKDAKELADQKLPHHADEVKRVYVFLNPDANNRYVRHGSLFTVSDRR